MSPRTWTVCPKCKKEHESKVTSLRNKVTESYGKVSREEYKQLEHSLQEAEAADICDLENSLAEYYEHYWELNDCGVLTLHWRYNCNCQTCGFEFQTIYHVA